MASRCTRMNDCNNSVKIELSTSRGLFGKQLVKGKMGFQSLFGDQSIHWQSSDVIFLDLLVSL